MADVTCRERPPWRSGPASKLNHHGNPLNAAALLASVLCVAAVAPDPPLLFEDDFEQTADRWTPSDPAAWRLEPIDGGHAFSQFQASQFEPPHRSPFNIALLKEVAVGDFVLEARLKSTVKDYGHRDMCLVFGYRDAAHFYYVHLGKQADDHANQIFVVDDAPRIKISTTSTSGTPWDDDWHRVRIVRRLAEGAIEVYFDDFETPIMTATDKRFAEGQIGIGSFDDTGLWDDVKLYGTTSVD